MSSGSTPAASAPAAAISPSIAMCRPARPSRTLRVAGGIVRVQAPDLEVGALAVLGDDPRRRSSRPPRGPASGRSPPRCQPDVDPAAGPRAEPSDDRWQRPGRRGSRRASPPCPPSPRSERTTAASSGKTSGWSHSALMRTAMSGRYGSKLPAYSSASTTKSGPAPNRATPRSPPVIALGSWAPTKPAGSRPATDEDVEEPPARRRLAVRAGDADEPLAARRRRVGDDLLDALGLDAQGACAPSSSGWSGSTDVTALVTARRSTAAVPSSWRTWLGALTQATGMPVAATTALSGSGPPASHAVTMAPTAAAWRAAPADAAPPTPMTWSRVPGAIALAGRFGARPAAISAAVRVTRRGPDPTGPRGPRPCSRRCSRSGRRSTGTAARRFRARRRPRRRRARPASCPSHRRARRRPSRPPRGRRRAVSRTPSAIASATWALTAPCCSSVDGGTPRSAALTAFE